MKKGIFSIANNATFLIGSRFLEKAIRFFYLIVLARYLGPEDLGLYNYGISWYLLFISLSMWGIGGFLSVEMGKKAKGPSEIISTSLFLRVCTTVLGFCACLFLAWITNENQKTLIIVVVVSSALIGRSFATYGRNLFVADEKSHVSAVSEIFFRITEFAIGGVWLLLGGNLLGICLIHSGIWLCEAISLFLFSRMKFDYHIYIPPFDKVRELFIQCLPFALYVTLWAAFLQIGMVLLKNISSDSSHLGYYTIGFQIVLNLVLLPQAFGSAALPVLSRVAYRGTAENKIYLESVVKLCCLFGSLLLIAVMFYRRSFIHILFGDAFIPAEGTLLVFSACMMFLFAVPCLDKIILSSNRKVWIIFINLFALGLNIILTIALYPRLSFNGPAMAMAISSIALLASYLMLIHKTIFRLNWWSMVIKPYTYAFLAIIVSLLLLDYGWSGFLAGVASILGLHIFGRIFSHEEKMYFRRLFSLLS